MCKTSFRAQFHKEYFCKWVKVLKSQVYCYKLRKHANVYAFVYQILKIPIERPQKTQKIRVFVAFTLFYQVRRHFELSTDILVPTPLKIVYFKDNIEEYIIGTVLYIQYCIVLHFFILVYYNMYIVWLLPNAFVFDLI